MSGDTRFDTTDQMSFKHPEITFPDTLDKYRQDAKKISKQNFAVFFFHRCELTWFFRVFGENLCFGKNLFFGKKFVFWVFNLKNHVFVSKHMHGLLTAKIENATSTHAYTFRRRLYINVDKKLTFVDFLYFHLILHL